MKLLKAILIIFLILSSHVIESKAKLKRNKNHYKVSSRTKQTTIDELFAKLMEGENLFDFIVGALSVWYPSFNEVYQKKKSFKKFAKHCFTTATFLKNGKLEAQKSVSTNDEWLNLENEDDRYNFCVNTKKEIRENYFGDSWSKYISSFIRSPEYCDVNENQKQRVVEKYGSLNTYRRECLFFEGLNCDTIKNSIFSKVKSFLSNSMSYLTGINSTITCLTNIKDFVVEFEFVKRALESSLAEYVKSAAGVLANYLTGSAWGTAKGSYLIVDLGMKLYDFSLQISQTIVDAYFILGQLVAKAINAGKAFLIGKKRRVVSKHKSYHK